MSILKQIAISNLFFVLIRRTIMPNTKFIKLVAKKTLQTIKLIERNSDITITKVNLPINKFINKAAQYQTGSDLVEIYGKYDSSSIEHVFGTIRLRSGYITYAQKAQLVTQTIIDTFNDNPQDKSQINLLAFMKPKEVVPEVRELLTPTIQSILNTNYHQLKRRVSVIVDEHDQSFMDHDELVDTVETKLEELLKILDVNHDINVSELDQNVVTAIINRLFRPDEPELDPKTVIFYQK